MIKDDFRLKGFGFHDYPGYKNYGVACIAKEWFFGAASCAGLEVLEFRRDVWAGQDVVVVRRLNSLS
ncbi:hypothetical protein H4684_001215 [Desulfomicrobium macestii]|uniref:Uncharacterized protein n=1 Tax=Desulfomicrobium macestii TaxID=90731 RepID=A0ABR9H1K0_9BACT|nr:hypothetical protein [Desulfomicrobium macestii]